MAEQRVQAAGHDVTEDHALQAPLTVVVVVCLAPRQTQQWELQYEPFTAKKSRSEPFLHRDADAHSFGRA
jgi:hypothetical protein